MALNDTLTYVRFLPPTVFQSVVIHTIEQDSWKIDVVATYGQSSHCGLAELRTIAFQGQASVTPTSS